MGGTESRGLPDPAPRAATTPPPQGGDDPAPLTRSLEPMPRDEELARRAVLAGDALALPQVLIMLRGVVPGDVLTVNLRRDAGGRWLYAVLILAKGGVYKDALVDAKANTLLQVRSR